jgi:hypothetical protein
VEAEPKHHLFGGERPGEAIDAVAERRRIVVGGAEVEVDAVEPVIGVRRRVVDPFGSA